MICIGPINKTRIREFLVVFQGHTKLYLKTMQDYICHVHGRSDAHEVNLQMHSNIHRLIN